MQRDMAYGTGSSSIVPERIHSKHPFKDRSFHTNHRRDDESLKWPYGTEDRDDVDTDGQEGFEWRSTRPIGDKL